MKIKNIYAREILDSRGNPTVECSVVLDSGIVGCASVPSGASVGKYEALELRDGDAKYYRGKGVKKAIKNIEEKIFPALKGKDADVYACDSIMRDLDGTPNKSVLGANAILPVSVAVLRVQAIIENKKLYELLGELADIQDFKAPTAMFNVLNGGAHATNNLSFQEFMVMPMGNKIFAQNLHMAALIYHTLKELLIEHGYETGVGDEGGFAPRLKKRDKLPEREALDLLLKATDAAGFEPGNDVVFCLDVAASQFFNKEKKKYLLQQEELSSSDIIYEYKQLINEYPIYSIEDGLDEDDWDGWKSLTEELGDRVKLVGDDIFVSNPDRIKKGVEEGAANTVLIKPNQIGTVTEALDAIKVCKEKQYEIVISHRSGETNDTFISDLAVGVRAPYIKAGAPARGERVAKYNRLLEIGL